MTITITPFAKNVWEDVQKKHDVPVNAIGMKIDPRDTQTLDLWRKLGIDRFMKVRNGHLADPAPPPAAPAAERRSASESGEYLYRGNSLAARIGSLADPAPAAADRPQSSPAPAEPREASESGEYYYRGNRVTR